MDPYYELTDLGTAPELDLSVLSPTARKGVTETHRVKDLGVDGIHMLVCQSAHLSSAKVQEVPVGNLFANLPICCDEDVSEFSESASIIAQAVRGVRNAGPTARTHLERNKRDVEDYLHVELAALAPQLRELNAQALVRHDEWCLTEGRDFLRALSVWAQDSAGWCRPERGDRTTTRSKPGGFVLARSRDVRYSLLKEVFPDLLEREVVTDLLSSRALLESPDLAGLLGWAHRRGLAKVAVIELSAEEDPGVAEVAHRLLLDGFENPCDALIAARELV